MAPAAAEAELPEALIEEILIKLPIKSLMEFKRVSKQWLRLINSHSFAFRQYSIAKVETFDNPTASFFVVRVPENLRGRNFVTPVSLVDVRSGAHEFRIHENIDIPHMETTGDVALHTLFPAGFGIYCVFEQLKGGTMLWNPTTGETKVLPPSPHLGVAGHSYLYTFGWVDYKDGNFSYKVGRIDSTLASPCNFKRLSLDLYSSKTNSWKLMQDFCVGENVSSGMSYLPSANLNGRAHWLIFSDKADHYVTSFDYETEVFRRIRAPLAPQVGRYKRSQHMVTLYDDKFLCLILCWINNDKLFFDIWVMREYGVEDSWTKEFTVGPIPKNMEVLGIWNKVHGIFLRHRGDFPTRLFLCDYKSSIRKRVHPIGADQRQYMQVMECAQSVISFDKF